MQNKEIILCALNKYKDHFITLFDAKNKFFEDKLVNANEVELSFTTDNLYIDDMYTQLSSISSYLDTGSITELSWDGKKGEEQYEKFIKSFMSYQELKVKDSVTKIANMLLNLDPNYEDFDLVKIMKKFESSVVPKSVNKDLTSESLTQMVNAPEDLDKPGMPQLIKNVLKTYFANKLEDKDIPFAKGLSDECKDIVIDILKNKKNIDVSKIASYSIDKITKEFHLFDSEGKEITKANKQKNVDVEKRPEGDGVAQVNVQEQAKPEDEGVAQVNVQEQPKPEGDGLAQVNDKAQINNTEAKIVLSQDDIQKIINSVEAIKAKELIQNKDAREIDKRSMISSMIRYSDAKSSQATILGSMFKGTGPLMQKLLQSLNIPGMDKELKEALQDMKSNLMPIESTYVQAQMNKLIQNSNNTIQKIKIDKPLGAASVGQAFLVTYTDNFGNDHRAVLKVIRPDIKQKALREFEMFKAEAAKIPGMLETYTGIYEQYKKEFDLRDEASNIKLGLKHYGNSLGKERFDTMSLVPGIEPTETSMLLSVADGQTLDSYIRECQVKINELKNKKFNNYEELLALRKDAFKLYQQIYDVSVSMGKVAENWFTNALFPKGGDGEVKQAFFHGDMHAGNLMVKAKKIPSDNQPNNEIEDKAKEKVSDNVSKITVIDYGNASVLDAEQAQGLFRINAACTIGGLYQFEANEEEKAVVEKKTKEMFLAGFEKLLSPEDYQKFKENVDKGTLYKDVIKPILFKGSRNETAARLSLLIKKLQEVGVGIPGPVINMAESEKRMSNAMNDVNSLLTQLSNMFNENLFFNNCIDSNELLGTYLKSDSLDILDISELSTRFELDISEVETKLKNKKRDLNSINANGQAVAIIRDLNNEINELKEKYVNAAKDQFGFMLKLIIVLNIQ